MGFIKAFSGAIGGTFADTWKDFYGPMEGVSATAGLFRATAKGTNAGRGSNTSGSENIITNGSKIIVPEGTALITMQDGAITGMIAEPGGYEFHSDDQNSKSMFSGDGILSSTVTTSWERFKFGGIPGTEQLAFYVNLKEIPNNKFGTAGVIYWDDAYLNAQVGAVTRGTFTLKIVDPLLFVKNIVPQSYLQADSSVFDFADLDNPVVNQLLDEVVSSLTGALSRYTGDPSNGNRITKIQSDQVGFAKSLSEEVEAGYSWKTDRGLEIVKTAILAIEYDEDTQALLSDVKKADALSGARGNAFMQQSVARGVQAAGENGGGTGMAFMGMGVNAGGSIMNQTAQESTAQTNPFISVSQQPQASAPVAEATSQPQAQAQASAIDPYEEIKKAKELLDAGIISQEDFDAKKKQLLGI